MTGDEEGEEIEDDDFQPITQEELDAIEKKKNALSDDDDSEGDNSDEESEESEDEASFELTKPNLAPKGREPHPQMLTALKRALGRYAITEDASDDDEEIEMNDEEMAALDQRLSNVMKCFTSKGRKVMLEDAKLYRQRISEILTILMESSKDDLNSIDFVTLFKKYT